MRSRLIEIKQKFYEDKSNRSFILLVFQLVLIALLFATIALIFFVDMDDRLVTYLALVVGLTAALLLALGMNLNGRYQMSAWLTTIIIAVGPWGSFLLDPMIMQGDFIPLVYLALSIQLCAIFLSEKATLIIGLLQFVSLIIFIVSSPALMAENWPSLMAFVVFAATIGMVSSFANRKQVEQIEKHRNQLQLNEALLRRLAERDALTGLFNRRYMEETLEREISRAQRKEQSLGIIMADVNNFKVINDTHGHAMGDDVLRQVARVLAVYTRGSDVVCRYGGDEFVIILPECTLEQTKNKAMVLGEVMSNVDFNYQNKNCLNVQLSFGVSALPDQGMNADELLLAADRSMYKAKKKEEWTINTIVN